MKTEEFDWMVYHAIAWGHAATIPALIEYVGGEKTAVEESVDRLVSYMIIERDGEKVRALSVEESILKCQLKHAAGIPLEIENGVIKIPDFARNGDKP
ncbi:MAG: MarR family transcriptional regulator [Methanofollis sp.]|nr:MarR family transcriptional regulator [Methanofollis sp.]